MCAVSLVVYIEEIFKDVSEISESEITVDNLRYDTVLLAENKDLQNLGTHIIKSRIWTRNKH